MSNHTVSTLPRISNQELSSILLAHTSSNLDAPNEPKHVAIVDVRDDDEVPKADKQEDHIGGHIRHSLHVPSHTHDHKIPELVRKLADKEIVVFHCALSQVRGPKAALRYVRERERLIPSASTAGSASVGTTLKTTAKSQIDKEGEKDADGEWEDIAGEEESKDEQKKEQKVFVLKGGFVEWQEVFGEDSRLTEGYEKSIWKEGYWM